MFNPSFFSILSSDLEVRVKHDCTGVQRSCALNLLLNCVLANSKQKLETFSGKKTFQCLQKKIFIFVRGSYL